MAFLGGLFKKKPGGTLFGNLLRGATSKLTGGILGTGANRIEVGQTLTNAQLAAQANNPLPSPVLTAVQQAAGENPQIKAAIGGAIWEKYKVAIIGGVLALVGLIVFLATRKKQRPGRR